MCGDSRSDPSMHDQPPTCEGRFWKAGMDNRCGQTVALHRWTDVADKPHAGCPKHAAGLQRRYPESLIEHVADHGTLALSTPWARGLFAPNDRIAIENLIPSSWTIGVSVEANRAHVILWLLDPQKRERTRWANFRLPNAVWAATKLAEHARSLAGDLPEPEWLDSITAAKAEAERVAS